MSKVYVSSTQGTYVAPLRERISVAVGNWWRGAFGRRASFNEGVILGMTHAAMVAKDLGSDESHMAINQEIDRYRDGSIKHV